MNVASRLPSCFAALVLAMLVPEAWAQGYYWTGLAGNNDVPSFANGTGSAARFYYPNAAVIDASGNLYVSESGNHVIRKVTSSGEVTTLAGSPGLSGSANGTGSGARFNSPRGVALDGSGNLYVADSNNHTIRKITSAGVVTTVAGSPGSSGSTDGTGSAARFYYPRGVAVHASGSIYVSDLYNHTIRVVSNSGVVTTLAGSAGTSGNANGVGSVARFNEPAGIAVDTNGVIYVADTYNRSIRRLTSDGSVTTFATGLSGPMGVAVSGSGNVYVADEASNSIRKITSGGSVSTLAGAPGYIEGNRDGTGTAARFYQPHGVAVDSTGTVFVCDSANHTIRRVTEAGVVTTLAGRPAAGSNDGIGTDARFYGPEAVAADGSGNIYVADTDNCTIRKITSAGVVTTLAGSVELGGNVDGLGSAARFNYPSALAADAAGTLYVASSSAIRKVTGDGTVTTFVGSATAPGSTDGTGNAARLNNPRGVAVDATGNVYVADSSNYTIRKSTSAGVVTTLAGTAGQRGSVDGTGTAVRFWYPQGIAVDGSGNVYVSDNQTIRKVTPAGAVTTLAGSPGQVGSTDGAGSVARFNYPKGIAADASGSVFVADNARVRKITSAGVVTTIGGNSLSVPVVNGLGTAAQFYGPSGVAVDTNGVLYLVEMFHHRVARGSPPPTAAPVASPAVAAPGQSVSFNAHGFTTDPQRSVASCIWAFGDGINNIGATPSHAYALFGNYTASVTVTDNVGNTGTVSVPVAVNIGNLPPSAHAGGPYLTRANASMALNGSGSSDPNGALDGISRYEWDVNNDGIYDISSSSSVSALTWAQISSYGMGTNGTYTVRLRTTDRAGATGVATASLTVDLATQAPILRTPVSGFVNSSMEVSFSLPEPAANGTVKLIFTGSVSRTLFLVDAQGTAGEHSFILQPASLMFNPVIASIDGGLSIPDGVYSVTLSYQDLARNTAATHVATNVQIDATAPTLHLPANLIAEATTAMGAAVNYTASASDAGTGVASSGFLPASGSIFPLGPTTVNANATDYAGNTGTGSFNITVRDTTPPAVTVPSNIATEATGSSGAVVTFNVSAMDLVDGSLPATPNHASGSTFPLGTTTVHVSAQDTRGNNGSTSFTVTVQDTTKPVVTVPAAILVEATEPQGAAVVFNVDATDTVDGSRPATPSHPSGSTFPLGTTTVTVTAQDTHGNTGTNQFTVTVQDTTGPEITVPANIIAEATGSSGAVVTFDVSATDLVDGPLSATAEPASGSTFPLGTTIVHVATQDTRGNNGSNSFTVTVQDTTKPVVTVPANITAEATGSNGAVVTFDVSATDLVDGPLPATPDRASGSIFPLGMTTVNVAALDARGNSGSHSFTVTVQDTTAPDIIVPANIIVEATGSSGAAVIFSVSASDIVDGPLPATSDHASGGTFPVGTTVVKVSAKDARGNDGSHSFTVTVQDTTKPVVTVPANITVEATGSNGAVVTFDVSAVDTVDGSRPATPSHPSGSTFPLGTTTVTVTAQDSHGNTGTNQFTVTVEDTTQPEITVPVNIIAEATGRSGAVVTFDVSATDRVDGALPATAEPASGSTFPLGTTSVHVAAQDTRGNNGSNSFTVTVQDTTKPIVMVPANIIAEATGSNGAVVTFDVSATDLVDGPLPATPDQASGSTFPLGMTTVTVSAIDAVGNTQTKSFTVTVQDTTPPTISGTFTPLHLTVAQGETAALPDYLAQAAMDDAVGVTNKSQEPPAGTLIGEGTTLVTLKAEDAAQHETTRAFTVTVRVGGTAVLAESGAVVPGAGTDPRIPAGSTWGTFGLPSITLAGTKAGWAASVRTPATPASSTLPRGQRAGSFTGIFLGPILAPTLRAKTEDFVRDASGAIVTEVTFKSFREPVFAGNDYAMIATVRGTAPTTDTGIWCETGGRLREIAREGGVAPGTSAKFKAFTSVSMPTAGTVFFVATLATRETKSMGLWVWTETGGAQLCLREGDPISLPASAAPKGGAVVPVLVKSFQALTDIKSSPGHGRYDAEVPAVDALLKLSGGRSAAVSVRAEADMVLQELSGAVIGTAGEIAKLGMPASPGHDAPPAALVTLALDPSKKITGANNLAIAVLGGERLLAQKGEETIGAPAATFKSFSDPVASYFSGDHIAVAFTAALAGTTRTRDTGVWLSIGDSFMMVAREGEEPTGAEGTRWKSFTSLSILPGRGPIFTATLTSGSTRVNAANDLGFWAIDSSGTMRLILREGDLIEGRQLQSFDVLGAVAGSPGQRRAWTADDASARVICRARFTDGSTAILSTAVP